MDNNRAGVWGGDTIDSSALDIDSNRYLGSATATLEASYYYDRTQSGEQGQDSDPMMYLSDIGVDPNWYNGVSLQTECKTNCLSNDVVSLQIIMVLCLRLRVHMAYLQSMVL